MRGEGKRVAPRIVRIYTLRGFEIGGATLEGDTMVPRQ